MNCDWYTKMSCALDQMTRATPFRAKSPGFDPVPEPTVMSPGPLGCPTKKKKKVLASTSNSGTAMIDDV